MNTLVREVAEVSESQLWKLKYKTFGEFTRLELSIGAEYSRVLLRIHARFSRDDYEKVGPTKLKLLLQCPPTKLQIPIDRAASMSKREIEKVVRIIVAEHPSYERVLRLALRLRAEDQDRLVRALGGEPKKRRPARAA
jgi:hypothetical protein